MSKESQPQPVQPLGEPDCQYCARLFKECGEPAYFEECRHENFGRFQWEDKLKEWKQPQPVQPERDCLTCAGIEKECLNSSATLCVGYANWHPKPAKPLGETVLTDDEIQSIKISDYPITDKHSLERAVAKAQDAHTRKVYLTNEREFLQNILDNNIMLFTAEPQLFESIKSRIAEIDEKLKKVEGEK